MLTTLEAIRRLECVLMHRSKVFEKNAQGEGGFKIDASAFGRAHPVSAIVPAERTRAGSSAFKIF